MTYGILPALVRLLAVVGVVLDYKRINARELLGLSAHAALTCTDWNCLTVSAAVAAGAAVAGVHFESCRLFLQQNGED